MRPLHFNVVHVAGDQHAPIFSEVIDLFSDALVSLGHTVGRAGQGIRPDAVNLIFGPTAFLDRERFAPLLASRVQYVAFQAETLGHETGFSPSLHRGSPYYDFLQRASQIWDYSPTNVAFLAGIGLGRAHHVPAGFSPRSETVARADIEDIDVLFYGSNNPRREWVFDRLRGSGMSFVHLFGAYGAERDDAIARAKVVLNVHQFEAPQLEQLRLSFLLNNRKFVISELGDINPYGDGVVYCSYPSLVECCAAYLRPDMEAERGRIAGIGYEALRAVPMLESLRSALGEWPRAHDRDG